MPFRKQVTIIEPENHCKDMDLIYKEDMTHKKWRTFEHYPKQGEDIVLHVKGYRIRENKYCHDFVRIRNFDGATFQPSVYAQQIKSVVWKFSWLPVSQLTT